MEGFERYLVSDFGRVRNSKTGRILRSYVNNAYQDYRRYCLSSCGKVKAFLAHRLVWTAFRGEIPLTMDIDHIDSDPSNNRLDNLQLLPHRENCQKKRGGRRKRGECTRRNQPKAKQPMPEETKAKLRAAANAYWESRKAALMDEARSVELE